MNIFPRPLYQISENPSSPEAFGQKTPPKPYPTPSPDQREHRNNDEMGDKAVEAIDLATRDPSLLINDPNIYMSIAGGWGSDKVTPEIAFAFKMNVLAPLYKSFGYQFPAYAKIRFDVNNRVNGCPIIQVIDLNNLPMVGMPPLGVGIGVLRQTNNPQNRENSPQNLIDSIFAPTPYEQIDGKVLQNLDTINQYLLSGGRINQKQEEVLKSAIFRNTSIWKIGYNSISSITPTPVGLNIVFVKTYDIPLVGRTDEDIVLRSIQGLAEGRARLAELETRRLQVSQGRNVSTQELLWLGNETTHVHSVMGNINSRRLLSNGLTVGEYLPTMQERILSQINTTINSQNYQQQLQSLTTRKVGQ